MAKPFERVERLPVPPEVHDSFKKLESAHVSRGHVSSAAQRARSAGRSAADVYRKTEEKVTNAETEAAQHFGGDVGRMSTHFKRWQRWGKTMMSPAGLAEDVAGAVARRAYNPDEDLDKAIARPR